MAAARRLDLDPETVLRTRAAVLRDQVVAAGDYRRPCRSERPASVASLLRGRRNRMEVARNAPNMKP